MKKLIKKQGFTLVELMIVVAIIGILAAIAIPNFIRFQARSKQTEARSNLKAIFTGQKSYFAENDRYSTGIGDIGFAPERGNRYMYSLIAGLAAGTAEGRTGNVATPGGSSVSGVSVDTYRYPGQAAYPTLPTTHVGTISWTVTGTGITAPTAAEGGVFGTCPTCSYSASARGNIDNETSGIDYMTSSSEFITVTTGACNDQQDNVTPGASAQLFNDVSCDS